MKPIACGKNDGIKIFFYESKGKKNNDWIQKDYLAQKLHMIIVLCTYAAETLAYVFWVKKYNKFPF